MTIEEKFNTNNEFKQTFIYLFLNDLKRINGWRSIYDAVRLLKNVPITLSNELINTNEFNIPFYIEIKRILEYSIYTLNKSTHDDFINLINISFSFLKEEQRCDLLVGFAYNLYRAQTSSKYFLTDYIAKCSDNIPTDKKTKILEYSYKFLDQKNVFIFNDILSTHKLKNNKYIRLIKNEVEENKEILNIIADTPSFIRGLQKTISPTFNEILNLAPCKRLKFLKFMYHEEIMYDKISKILKSKIKFNKVKIMMPEISKEQMEQLLFSTSLKKNDEVSNFYNAYCIYLDRSSLIKQKQQEIQLRLFELEKDLLNI